MTGLIHHENQAIREEVKVVLLLRFDELACTNSTWRELGWTTIQLGLEAIHAEVQTLLENGSLRSVVSIATLECAKQRLHDFAIQRYLKQCSFGGSDDCRSVDDHEWASIRNVQITRLVCLAPP